MAGKTEAQDLLAVLVTGPLPDTKEGVEGNGMTSLFQGFTHRRGLDRFVRIEVPGGLVVGEFAKNLFLDDQEAISARDDAGHRDTGAPDVFGLREGGRHRLYGGGGSGKRHIVPLPVDVDPKAVGKPVYIIESRTEGS